MGHLPWAPGTFGTLAGLPLYLALSGLPVWAYAACLAPLTLAAILLAGRAEDIYGCHDDPRIVIDEVVGFLVSMTGTAPSLPGMVLGFLFFRMFDILKPWPCRAIDRTWGGGTGIVMDDAAAGVYAAALLHVVQIIW